MASYRIGIYVAIIAVTQVFSGISAQLSHAADGPNRVTTSDRAAGQWIDSLLGPEMPHKSKPKQVRRSTKTRRAPLHAKLIDNPNTKPGNPPFALIDQNGRVLRFIKPESKINLDPYVGEIVTVRRDTGKVLNASQLALPETSEIQLAQDEEPIPAGEVVDPPSEAVDESSILTEMPLYEENGPAYLDEGIDFGGCAECGDVCCGGACGYGARGVMYVHGEYALWWLEGMNTPPLVVQRDESALPFVSTILYGGDRVLDNARHGGRVTVGLWLDDYGKWGLEGDYLGLGILEDRFQAGVKDGVAPALDMFIYRPFFNTGIIDLDDDGNIEPEDLLTRGRSLEDVDTDELDGTVRVDIRSDFSTAGIRLRHNMCCRPGCSPCCGDGVSCGVGVGCGSAVGYGDGPFRRLAHLLRNGTRRTDVIYGLRFANLDESLQVTEDLRVIEVGNPNINSEIDVIDRFATDNNFFGGEIGFTNEWELNRWTLRLLSKVAIGNTRQKVSINGSTTTDNMPSSVGGLLAQRFIDNGADGLPNTADDVTVGNIGSIERDEFSMIPELSLMLGYNLTQRLKVTAGYTLLYWSNVVRPGDQIDLDVNANLLPRNGAPRAGSIVLDDHPRFVWRQTDLWAQGLNFGAEMVW